MFFRKFTKIRYSKIILLVFAIIFFFLLVIFLYSNYSIYSIFPKIYNKDYSFPAQDCEKYFDFEIESHEFIGADYGKCICYGEAYVLQDTGKHVCEGIEFCHRINKSKEKICEDNYEEIKIIEKQNLSY